MKAPLFVITVALIQLLTVNAFCAYPPVREHLLMDYNRKFVRASSNIVGRACSLSQAAGGPFSIRVLLEISCGFAAASAECDGATGRPHER